MHDSQNQSLPVGYRLHDGQVKHGQQTGHVYEIIKVLNTGGFSVVYIAQDASGNSVAIKEYLPTELALRADGINVSVNSPEAAASFRHGLQCFFEEGRALANIDHHNIVRVLNFFRANETVYMVMQYERGRSLQESILKHHERLSENFIRRVFSELLNGLREVHAQKLLHLDIKPSNIYIRLDGSPVLLDFGSARQTLTDVVPKLLPSYTPGFACPEQYYDRKLLGPWSDIYSVGASMYSCIARAAPMASNKRMKKDHLMPAIKLGKDHYSQNLLQIIDSCLALDHMQRPQSVYTLQKSLLKNIPTTPVKPSLLNKIKHYLNTPL